MALDTNCVVLVGRLGADPEYRVMPNSDRPVANLRVATNKRWKDSSGEKKERTEWHRVVIFGPLADVAKEYAKKGMQVSVVGELRTEKWQDKEGVDRYTTEIVADQFGFAGKTAAGEPEASGGKEA